MATKPVLIVEAAVVRVVPVPPALVKMEEHVQCLLQPLVATLAHVCQDFPEIPALQVRTLFSNIIGYCKLICTIHHRQCSCIYIMHCSHY